MENIIALYHLYTSISPTSIHYVTHLVFMCFMAWCVSCCGNLNQSQKYGTTMHTIRKGLQLWWKLILWVDVYMQGCTYTCTFPMHCDWFLTRNHVPDILDVLPWTKIAVNSSKSVKIEFYPLVQSAIMWHEYFCKLNSTVFILLGDISSNILIPISLWINGFN